MRGVRGGGAVVGCNEALGLVMGCDDRGRALVRCDEEEPRGRGEIAGVDMVGEVPPRQAMEHRPSEAAGKSVECRCMKYGDGRGVGF